MSIALYRFQINLSDVDRGCYERLDFRLMQHPSENLAFLLTRMLAYALNYQDGLAFSAEGLCNPDDPCLAKPDPKGGMALWIEVGNPSARRLHKAAKAASKVRVYTYKNPQPLLEEVAREKVYNSERIELFAVEPAFLDKLEALLARDNEWDVMHNEGSLTVNVGDISEATELRRLELPR
jgi:uncharacterized protein YaeQ